MTNALFHFLRCTAAALTLLWAAGTCIFGLPLTTLWILMLAAAVALTRRSIGVWLGLLLLPSFIPMIPIAIVEYQDRADMLQAKVDRSGPGALTLWDCSGIYVLNLGMAGVGSLIGFHDVALETLLLAVPGPDQRHFYSDLPLASPEVREAISTLKERPEAGPLRIRPTSLNTWREIAAVLALDANLVVEAKNPEATDFVAKADIRYPRKHHLVLFRLGDRPIGIQEGLFWALQERGLFHPYHAHWHFSAPDR